VVVVVVGAVAVAVVVAVACHKKSSKLDGWDRMNFTQNLEDISPLTCTTEEQNYT
jgi:hypothetical protein